MTAVIVAPRIENPLSDTESVVTGGSFRLRPAKGYSAGGQWVLPVWGQSVNLQGSPVTTYLDPLAGIPYQIEVTGPDGQGGRFTLTEFRIVIDSGTPVKWEDLEKVGNPDGDDYPITLTEARLDAMEALLATYDGGATAVDNLTDASALAKLILKASTAAAMRTLLDAAATAHEHTISDLDVTGTASSSTFLRGDASWSTTPVAGNPDWADITGKPSTFAPSAHTHPGSDITSLTAADIDDSTTVGRAVLMAADAAAARTAIAAFGGSDQITAANLPAATVMRADGAATPRPSTRTDLTVLWTASSAPSNAEDADVWLNGPDS